jgi:methyl-accepting chemotaxis protein
LISTIRQKKEEKRASEPKSKLYMKYANNTVHVIIQHIKIVNNTVHEVNNTAREVNSTVHKINSTVDKGVQYVILT